MYKYGEKSLSQLNTCAYPLQQLFREAIRHRDISILEGHRDNAKQDQEFQEGRSKLRGGESEHNKFPSRAVDAVPYPLPPGAWEDREFWVEWTSWIKGLATGMGINIISGYDWDNDYDLGDQKFYDGPHFQLADEN